MGAGRSWRAPGAWWVAGALALGVLPWHMREDAGWGSVVAPLGPADAASALAQALLHGRWWFWPAIAALALAGAALAASPSRRARLLALAGALGLAAIVAQAAAIGLNGWTVPWLEAVLGALPDRQPGIGLGGALASAAFLFLLCDGLAGMGICNGDRFASGAVGLLVGSVALFTVWPMATVLMHAFGGTFGDMAERFLQEKAWGLACLSGGGRCGAAWNTLALAGATAACCTALGLCFALIVTRTRMRGRRTLRLLTVLPIITPPFVVSLGLILVFGRSGLVNQAIEALTGAQPGRWIYGFGGVWLAQVFSFTPTAFLVLIGVVEGVSPTLEEASQSLRGDLGRTFRSVTLPLMAPGLANAFLVAFVESLADFGNPLVLGGSFAVLSTEIFFSVVGAQADFGRAAALALILTGFALTVFLLQRFALGRRSYVSIAGKGDAGLPSPLPSAVRRLAFAAAVPWTALTITIYALALAGGFVKVWGRDWTPTFAHFGRAFALEWGAGGLAWTGGAWASLWTTLALAAVAAPLTAALGLLAAWVLSRQRFRDRAALEFALMLSFGVPGTVIGVAYILAYNVPPLEITGTATILVLCLVFRNLPVGVRSGIAAMSQLDRSLDEASATLRAPAWRTLRLVLLPLLRPAMVTALVYSFVRAVTTVSAIIFLVSAEHEMATVFIINRVINGDYGLAIAYATALILLMLGAIAAVQLAIGVRRLGRRAPAVAAPGRAPA